MFKNMLLGLLIALATSASVLAMSSTGDGDIVGGDGGSGSITGSGDQSGGGWDYGLVAKN